MIYLKAEIRKCSTQNSIFSKLSLKHGGEIKILSDEKKTERTHHQQTCTAKIPMEASQTELYRMETPICRKK